MILLFLLVMIKGTIKRMLMELLVILVFTNVKENFIWVLMLGKFQHAAIDLYQNIYITTNTNLYTS